MQPTKIKGTYILRASLDAVVNSYQFTGNDRNAELAAAADTMLNLRCADIDRPINTLVSLISNNALNIKSARLLTPGAAGLRPALNSQTAAIFTVVGRAADDISAESVGGFTFGVDLFNEWQDVNIKFIPKKVNNNYYLSIDKSYTKLFVDDYNIQDDYLGQTFGAVLEMLVDTAGVLDNAGVIV